MKLHFALPCALLLSGCGLFNSIFPGPAAPSSYSITPSYSGLDHKTLAIVVYVPRNTLDEYTGAREEISSFLVASMREHLPTTQIVSPRDVMNFQDDTLNWTSLPERDLGRHFSADRVLFVSVLNYSTRPAVTYANMQGHLRAVCHISDCQPDAGTQPVWRGVIDAKWPPDKPLDPTQNNDTAVRLRVLKSFADRLVHCFYEGGVDTEMPG